MPSPALIPFIAGPPGDWRIDLNQAVIGEGLPPADRLSAFEGSEVAGLSEFNWVLRGVTSNTRYTKRSEVSVLASKQAGLMRPEASRAALIPIRKIGAWWDLAQDERRAIFEEQSQHIAIGLDYLPAVARRLHHSRELGQEFDFLTWFEYAANHADAFEAMVKRLRRTREWKYIDREIVIRLTRG